MREPSFWWRPAGLSSGLLSPLAAVYGAVAASRMSRPGRLPVSPSSALAIRHWAAPARHLPRLPWRRCLRRPAAGRSCSAAVMAGRLPARSGSIPRVIVRPTSVTNRCCWRGSHPPSWRATARPARMPRARPARTRSSWTTVSRIRAAQEPVDPGGGPPPRHRQRHGVSGRSTAGSAREPAPSRPSFAFGRRGHCW